MSLAGQVVVGEEIKKILPCDKLVVRAKLVDPVRAVILDEVWSRPGSNRLVDKDGNDLGIDFEDYYWAYKFTKEKLCLI